MPANQKAQPNVAREAGRSKEANTLRYVRAMVRKARPQWTIKQVIEEVRAIERAIYRETF